MDDWVVSDLRKELSVHEKPIVSIWKCARGFPVLYVYGELTLWEKFLCMVFGVVVVYA